MMGSHIAGSVLLVVALIWEAYGLWQVTLGRNLPGILSWGYLPRKRPPRSRTWSRRRWRINGVYLLVLALPLGWSGLQVLHG